MPDGPEVWRWRCARGRAAISCMLKRQAGARTKDSTSSHGTQAVEAEDRCRQWRRECCVALAAGPRSDVRLGDSSWRFLHEPVSCRRCGRPGAPAPTKPCTLRVALELASARPVTSIRVYRACNCKRTVTGRPRGPVRSPHSRPGQSERAAGPGRATRVRTTCARSEESSGGGVVLQMLTAGSEKQYDPSRAAAQRHAPTRPRMHGLKEAAAARDRRCSRVGGAPLPTRTMCPAR